jgi:hypothetical protein
MLPTTITVVANCSREAIPMLQRSASYWLIPKHPRANQCREHDGGGKDDTAVDLHGSYCDIFGNSYILPNMSQ